MDLHLGETHAFGWVSGKHLTNKINDLTTQINRKLDVHLQDLVICLVLIGFALEGSFAGAQLVAKYA